MYNSKDDLLVQIIETGEIIWCIKQWNNGWSLYNFKTGYDIFIYEEDELEIQKLNLPIEGLNMEFLQLKSVYELRFTV